MHKDHVSAAASLGILLMIAGARKWTAITVGKKAMQHGHVETKGAKINAQKTANKRDIAKFKKAMFAKLSTMMTKRMIPWKKSRLQ